MVSERAARGGLTYDWPVWSSRVGKTADSRQSIVYGEEVKVAKCKNSLHTM